jgi:hypothetical protein
MAKQTGIAANFYIAGYDISGDVSAINTIKASNAVKEVTGIDKLAVERLSLLRDGELAISGWFDTVAGQEHPALNGAPTTNVLATACIGMALGNPAVNVWGKQVTYDLDRGEDGSLAVKSNVLADGYGLEWGQLLTTGKQTFTGTANGTGVDLGNAQMPAALTILGNTKAAASVVQTNAVHGMATGDSVTIAGSNSTVSIDGNWPITYVDPTHFSVPVDTSGGASAGNAGTVQRTSTGYGGSSYLQVFSLTGTSHIVKVQHSADNGVADAWADVAGLVHTSVTGRIVGERVATTTTTGIIKRWARIVITGVFNPSAVCVVLARNYTA